MNKLVFFLFLTFLASSCSNDEEALKQQLTEAQATIDSLKQSQTASAARPGVIYSICFWLSPNVTESDRTVFLQKLSELQLIESVKAFYITRPARTVTESSDHSYDYMAVAHFADRPGFNTFENHAYYLQFMQAMRNKWTRIQVYVADVR